MAGLSASSSAASSTTNKSMRAESKKNNASSASSSAASSTTNKSTRAVSKKKNASSASSSAAPSISNKSTRAATSKKCGRIYSGDSDDDVFIPPSCDEAIATPNAAVALRAKADRKFHNIGEVEARGNSAIVKATSVSSAASKVAADAKSAADKAIRETIVLIRSNPKLSCDEQNHLLKELLDGKSNTPADATTPLYILAAKAARLAALKANDSARYKIQALDKAKKAASISLAKAVKESAVAGDATIAAEEKAKMVATQTIAQALDESRAAERAAESVFESVTHHPENNVNNNEGLKDPPELANRSSIQYQMADDYFMGDSTPEPTVYEGGDCLMEDTTLKDHPEGMDDAYSTQQDNIIGDQWNRNRKKILFGGRPYKCNKVIGDPAKKGSTITKYYWCQMVLFNREGARWKPLQLPKGSLVVPKVKTDTALTYKSCKGTLRGSFSMHRGKMKHSFRAGNTNHICHNPTWVEGNTLDL